MHGPKWLLAGVAVLAVIGISVACGDDDTTDADSAATVAATEAVGASDLEDLPVAQRMTLEMRDLAFEPKQMSMRAGEVVELTFRNSAAQLHDFTIDEMDADVMDMMAGGGGAEHMMDDDMSAAAMHMAVEAGEEGVMRVRVREPGEYEYHCTVPGHREAGMTGMLTVE